ncbi:cation:proton antiporter [Paracoccus onubensis]|uniref:cation:proton antiporter domain-containing protein n=1 Tax=Paracoccus onubensis TaxID=1675788 RepID=UPI0027304B73|nr:cation:proton antiporter [Paracoccus onubensis]MDP0927229.1 cation:proton antiporter [Paracoccus onubensis]
MENFLLLATVYLTLMIVAVPLAVRLGLGSVLGYLTCGILLGPLVNLTGSDLDALQHFAELGVALMLFLIGLELEPRSLWQMRRKLVGFGAAQIVGTTLLLAAIAILFGLSWQAALVVGMILSLSSTAIVLQTLTEKGLMRTNGGRSAFSVLLTQDIAVILMIALMPLLAPFPHRNGASQHGDEYIGEVFMAKLPGWAGTLITLAAVGSVILLGQFAIRPIFRFVISARLREMETAMALLIVVGIASLMILVGLSPALGTFLAGVMLAGSEFRHELESQIEPFKGLLLGLFFITVGAGMDLQLLLEKPVPILGITAALIGTKALVVGIIARMTKMGRTDRSLFTLSLAQAGEFGFVLIAYAVSLAILPKSLAEGFLLVIALSMLVTPLLFIIHGQIRRRLNEKAGNDTPSDDIDEQQPIIIAGVGRFGQAVNRLVTMSGFQTTVLDHDLKVIQVMRRFGFKGYFGDPTRPEILAAAGLDTAGILVAALDNPAANLKLISYARERRPDLHIICRARDRVDVYRLYAAGANDIVRELFDSSLRAGRYVLENAGVSEYEAAELEKIFYRLDRAALRDLAELWKPDVPLEQNTEYVKRSQELNKTLESALINRFAAPTDEFPPDGKDEQKQPETQPENKRSGEG